MKSPAPKSGAKAPKAPPAAAGTPPTDTTPPAETGAPPTDTDDSSRETDATPTGGEPPVGEVVVLAERDLGDGRVVRVLMDDKRTWKEIVEVDAA